MYERIAIDLNPDDPSDASVLATVRSWGDKRGERKARICAAILQGQGTNMEQELRDVVREIYAMLRAGTPPTPAQVQRVEAVVNLSAVDRFGV